MATAALLRALHGPAQSSVPVGARALRPLGVRHSACVNPTKGTVAVTGGAESSQDPSSWCSVFINLARRPDRRTKLARTLAAGNSLLLAKLQRIEAVDGQHISLNDAGLRGIVSEAALERARRAKAMGGVTIVHREGQLVRFHNHLTEGAIACAMSHRAALQAVASHPTADFGLILEDDICGVLPQVHESITHMVRRLPPNWDAVFLGYHGGALAGATTEGKDVADEHARAELELSIDDMRGASDGFQGSVHGQPNAMKTGRIYDPPVLRMFMPVFGLYAWIVRKQAAQALLREAFPIDGQVDHALSNWLVSQRGRCFRVAPRHLLFYSPKSEDSLDSDIQSMTTLDGLLEDPEACERYMHFVQGEEASNLSTMTAIPGGD